MNLTVSVTISNGKGAPKVYQLTQTAEATKNEKTGKTSLAHFQPAPECTVIKPFSKLYLDIAELGKAKSK